MAYTRAAAVTNTRMHNHSVQPAAALHQPPDSRQPCSQGGRSEQTLHNTAAESPVAHACAQFSATNARALHHAAQRIAQEQHLLRRAVAQHTQRRPLPQSHNEQGGVSIVSSPMLGMQTAHTAPILCICAAASLHSMQACTCLASACSAAATATQSNSPKGPHVLLPQLQGLSVCIQTQ